MDDICKERRTRAAGFTLVELMVAVGVLILSIHAVLGFADLLAEGRKRAVRQELRTLLAAARQDAVMRNQRLTLCRSQEAGLCAGNALAGNREWSAVLLFVDQDQDRLYTPGTDLLLRHVELPTAVNVEWNRGDAITYEPDGSVTGYSNGTFKLTFADDSLCTLVLALSGRFRESCS